MMKNLLISLSLSLPLPPSLSLSLSLSLSQGEGEKDLRKGSGTCACNSGYHGDFCDSCKPGYYLEDGGNNCRSKQISNIFIIIIIIIIIIVGCHRACLKTCNGSGPDSCDECAKGYKRDEEGGDCEGNINE